MNIQERGAFVERVGAAGKFAGPSFSLKEAKGDINAIVGIIRRRWRVVAVVTTIFVLLGVLALFALTPYYTARTSILLDPKRSAGVDLSAMTAGMPIDVGFVESEVAVISSFSIARRAVEKLARP